MSRILFVTCLFCCLDVVGNSKQKQVYSLTDEYVFIDDATLPAHIDREHQHTFKTILHTNDWNYNPAQFNYNSDLDANLWFRFSFNRGDEKKGCVIHLYNGLIPLFKLYKKQGERLELIDSLGSLFPHIQRANGYRDAIIELPYEEGVVEYYFMVNAKYYHGFDIAIRSYENLFNYALKEYYLLGAYYGILVLVLLYNLLYFFQVRDKLYLLYGFYVFVAILSSASTDLTGYWNMWPNNPSWSKFLVDQTRWLIGVSFVLYALHFLQVRQLGYKWFWCVVATSGLYIVYNFCVINGLLPVSVWLFLALLYSHLVFLWLSGWKSWRAGKSASGIFLIGLSMMVLAFAGYYLRYWELIKVNVPNQFVLHYGILAEVLVLTYAMSYRYKKERQIRIQVLEEKALSDEQLIEQLRLNEELKDKVNLELEEKVQEKTKELMSANKTLQEQALNIQTMNDELAKLNGELYMDKKKEKNARVLRKNMSKEEFLDIFQNNVKCYHLLNELKNTSSYTCKKCGHHQYSKGTGLLSKRCTSCGYNESITTGTIFKGFRSPLPEGFYMIYLLVESRFEMTSTDLAKASGLGTKTAWKLHKEVEQKFGKNHSNNWVDFLIL